MLPRSRGVAVEPAELEKGAAAADAAALKLLASRPELQHSRSTKAVGLTMRQVGAARQTACLAAGSLRVAGRGGRIEWRRQQGGTRQAALVWSAHP